MPKSRRNQQELRIVRGHLDAGDDSSERHTGGPASDGAGAERPALRLVADRPRSILVAGSDAGRRTALMHELSERLPADTSFQEAEATWEMLEYAPSSRMVMLAGDLEGHSAESIIHLLGSRHPQLPVVALGATASA